MSLAEAAIFEYAFKLGAKFMLECLTDHNGFQWHGCGVRNHTASFAFFKHSINGFKKLQYFAKKLESIIAKRKCL